MADVVLITDAGIALLSKRIKGLGTEPRYIGWGTGTTPPTATDTALETPVTQARALGVSSLEETSIVDDTYQVVGSLTCFGLGKTISEVGLFDAATDGTLLMRGTFDPPTVLDVGDMLSFTFVIPFERGV